MPPSRPGVSEQSFTQESDALRACGFSKNPYASQFLHSQDLETPPRIRYGRVVDYFPYMRMYRVQVENGPTIEAIAAMDTGAELIGAVSLNSIQIGSAVIVWSPSGSLLHYILNAIPDHTSIASAGISDFIQQGSGVGAGVDTMYAPGLGVGLPNMAAGRPVDSLSGEWGATSELGLKIFLDSWMAVLSASESTGIWAFYLDQLLRLAGHNLQIRSCMSEETYLDDQNEYWKRSRVRLYPWEALGGWEPDTPVYQSFSVSQILADSRNSLKEPVFADQRPVDRLITDSGFLGGIYRKALLLPLAGTIPSIANRLSSSRNTPAVFEEHLSATGKLTLRSAKGFRIVKTPIIVNPRQLADPDDPAGDQPADYKFSGTTGGGPDHVVSDRMGFDVGLDPTHPQYILRTNCVLDFGAYLRNWEIPNAFINHTGDWAVPEETATGFGSTMPPAVFTALRTVQFMAEPGVVYARVDHRYGNAAYYRNEASWEMTDDGGITQIDGFGSEITSVGGSIWLSAAGDLNLMAGRNVNIWAGKDLIFRAANCADVSASCGSVRVKAEKDFSVLAANSGEGGILLESRSRTTGPLAYDANGISGENNKLSGIVIKAAESRIVNVAANIDLALVQDSDEHRRIRLDAGTYGAVETAADSQYRIIGTAAYDIFPVTDADPVVHEWRADSASFGGELRVAGSIVSTGHIWADLEIASLQGHIYSGRVGALLRPMTAAQKTEVASVLDEIDDSTNSVDLATALLVTTLPFNDMLVSRAYEVPAFSFRLDAQYTPQEFAVYEAQWQKMQRFTNQPLAGWTEPVVAGARGIPTLPFPGYTGWTGQTYSQSSSDPDDTVWFTVSPPSDDTIQGFRTVDPTFIDPATGLAIDRSGNEAAYEAPEYQNPVTYVFDNYYMITVPQC